MQRFYSPLGADWWIPLSQSFCMKRLTVVLDIERRNCFVSLPRGFIIDREVPKLALKISWMNQEGDFTHSFVGWEWETHPEENTIRIPIVFADCLGLSDGQLITVAIMDPRNLTGSSRVFVKPATEEDSQVLELNQQDIELSLLNQIFVVNVGLKFPTWINNGTQMVILQVQDIGGGEYAILDRNTELIVETYAHHSSKDEDKNALKCLSSTNQVRSILLCPNNPYELIHGDFVSIASSFGVVEIRNDVKADQVIIPHDILLKSHIKAFSNVTLTKYDSAHSAIVEILLKPTKELNTQSFDAKAAVEKWFDVQNFKNIPMSQEEFITLKVGKSLIRFSLSFKGAGPSFLFNREAITKIQFINEVVISNVKEDPLQVEDIGIHSLDSTVRLLKTENIFGIEMHQRLMIVGSPGSGKSSFAKLLARELMKYTVYFPCLTLSGDRPDNIHLKVKKIFQEAHQNMPSILLFDDLDAILPMEEEEVPDLNIRVLASMFVEILKKSSPSVKIIFTCQNAESLHKSIQSLGIDKIVLPLPNKTNRVRILQHFVDMDVKFGTLEKIAFDTENYSPLDIVNLVDKMMNRTLMRNGTELELQDFEYALKTFTIQSTIGTKLLKSDTKWDDIGGLVDVKKMLRETFEIPTRYSLLFQNIPIKLRSGLLIYGPPGSGKTLLASAVSRECGLNFITIKGPELLNKYIGESEQGVRNVFQRAESAKPCIIFFDEFDSIAAQRGKDNTGVTDRVVNQLLVQLDGVESRSGVYVLAATSRPDLIDAALLRPGRLDKTLYCPLPNEEDRFDILHRMIKGVKLDQDVDLKKIARITENYSGADLQALLYTAQLEGSHELTKGIVIESKSRVVENQEEVNLENLLDSLDMKGTSTRGESPVIKITMSNFEKALEKTNPSLSRDDIQGYETLYQNFVTKKKSTKKKVTLA